MTLTIRNADADFLANLEKMILPRKDIVIETYDDEPNETTIAAMLEGDRIVNDPNVKGYTNLDELWADLEK